MRRANVGWPALFVLVAALVAIVAPANGFAQANQATGPLMKPEALVGTYKGTATTPDGEMALSVTLKYEKAAFTGTIEHQAGPTIAITGGSLTDERLVLNVDMGGTPGTITCTVKDPARIEGTWALGEASGTVRLTRGTDDPAKPPADKPADGASAPAAGAAQKTDPISGEWDGVTGNSDMSVPFTMRLKLDGDKVTGDISSEQGGAPLSTGSWKDGTLNLTFELGGMGTVTITGAIQEGKLVGSLDVAGQMQMQWAAVRKSS